MIPDLYHEDWTDALEAEERRRVNVYMAHPRAVFVFGSNTQGIHGAGAAKEAVKHWGARWGIGQGLEGRSYAIPTKDAQLCPLSLTQIAKNVTRFRSDALLHPEILFILTRVGCGLAGYADRQIAPLFRGVPRNVKVPIGWDRMIPQGPYPSPLRTTEEPYG